MADVQELEDKLSREQLNKLASEKGVESPEKLGNKHDVAEKLAPLVTPEEVEKVVSDDSEDDGKTELEKQSEGQHELGSIRDGSNQNESMRPSGETGEEDPGQKELTDDGVEKSVEGALETAEKNNDEENTISEGVSAEHNDFDPIAAGVEKAQANHENEQEDLEVTEDGTTDPVKEGLKQAKKNIAAEKAENKEAKRQAGKS